MGDIARATAIYSGGNIYLYYAELDNGNWLMGCDDWVIVVNTNPLRDMETFEASGFEDWQQEHLVMYVQEAERPRQLVKLIDVILQGNTIKEWDNFLCYDLEIRHRLLSEEIG